MRTNILIDDNLVKEAFLLTGLKTKRALINLALEELIRCKKSAKQPSLSDVFDQLRQLQISPDSFPLSIRQNRANPFADE